MADDSLLLTASKVKDMTEGGYRLSSILSKGDKKKATTGKSWVEFHYYAKNEYCKLPTAQKKALADWKEKDKVSNQKVVALGQQLRDMRDYTESLRETKVSINTSTLNQET